MNKNSEKFKQELTQTHRSVLIQIKLEMKRIKNLFDINKDEEEDDWGELPESQLAFEGNVFWNQIDEQESEVISRISLDCNLLFVDTGSGDYNMETKDINSEILIEVLVELENIDTFDKIE